MIWLANGATLEFAYVRQGGLGLKPNGLCLAETTTDWVTWRIWQDSGQRVWEAEVGNYFQKGGDPGAARQKAEIDFGKRLAALLTANSYEGLKETCEP